MAFGLSETGQHYIKAIRLYCEGNLLEALSYLDQGLAINPTDDKCFDMRTQIDQLNTKKMDGMI